MAVGIMTTSTKTLTTLVDAALAIEKLRVASEIRQTHLVRQGKQDPETDERHHRLKDFEDFVDGRVGYLIQSHPAYPWFSKVKGVGREDIATVVLGLIGPAVYNAIGKWVDDYPITPDKVLKALGKA